MTANPFKVGDLVMSSKLGTISDIFIICLMRGNTIVVRGIGKTKDLHKKKYRNGYCIGCDKGDKEECSWSWGGGYEVFDLATDDGTCRTCIWKCKRDNICPFRKTGLEELEKKGGD